MSGRAATPIAVIVAAVAAVALVVADAGGAARHVVVLAFLMLGPGLAVVGLLRLGDPVAELAIGVALSVVIDGLVASASMYAGVWSPEGFLIAVAGIAIACSALGLALVRGERAPDGLAARGGP